MQHATHAERGCTAAHATAMPAMRPLLRGSRQAKFFGWCAASVSVQAVDILREARALYAALGVPDKDVRGIGITVRWCNARALLLMLMMMVMVMVMKMMDSDGEDGDAGGGGDDDNSGGDDDNDIAHDADDAILITI